MIHCELPWLIAAATRSNIQHLQEIITEVAIFIDYTGKILNAILSVLHFKAHGMMTALERRHNSFGQMA